MKILRFESCGARVQVNMDVVSVEYRRPEEAILPDSRVEIVNLCSP
jgi:hypothetical protein